MLGALGVYELAFAWADALPLIDRAIAGCESLDTDLAERIKLIRLRFLVLVFHPDFWPVAVELTSSAVAVVRASALAALTFFATGGARGDYSREALGLELVDSAVASGIPPSCACRPRAVAAPSGGRYHGSHDETHDDLRDDRAA